VSVVLLAGGASRRMGTDKALLRVSASGLTLIQAIAAVAVSISDDLVIVSENSERLPSLPGRFVGDAVPYGGPLAGMVAGLQAARHPTTLVLACDLPFLSAPLLRAIAMVPQGWDAFVPRLPSEENPLGWEPLHASYTRPCLAPMQSALASGRRHATAFFPDIRVFPATVEMARAHDPSLRSTRSVNTPEAWAQAVDWLAHRGDPEWVDECLNR